MRILVLINYCKTYNSQDSCEKKETNTYLWKRWSCWMKWRLQWSSEENREQTILLNLKVRFKWYSSPYKFKARLRWNKQVKRRHAILIAIVTLQDLLTSLPWVTEPTLTSSYTLKHPMLNNNNSDSNSNKSHGI